MASEEHIKLADYLKFIHRDLRELSSRIGPTAAWEEHLKKSTNLKKYAESMNKLANEYWKKEALQNRIEWIASFGKQYFIDDKTLLQKYRDKEAAISGEEILPIIQFPNYEIKLLDVGSCYNPFKKYEFIIPLAIDIAPATDDVKLCDFLNINLLDNSNCHSFELKTNKSFERNQFDVVVFSLVLEYLPSSKQRLQLCQNAYEVLKPEGLLFIITPDSKHVGANAKLMKTWRYALALMGFARIKFEKLENITCMAFRRSVIPNVAKRWAEIHKEDYMVNAIHIPQDFLPIPDSLEKSKLEDLPLRNDDEILSVFAHLPNDFIDTGIS